MNPIDIIGINDRNRHIHVKNKELYTIKDINKFSKRPYEFKSPTFVPYDWKNMKEKI